MSCSAYANVLSVIYLIICLNYVALLSVSNPNDCNCNSLPIVLSPCIIPITYAIPSHSSHRMNLPELKLLYFPCLEMFTAFLCCLLSLHWPPGLSRKASINWSKFIATLPKSHNLNQSTQLPTPKLLLIFPGTGTGKPCFCVLLYVGCFCLFVWFLAF